MKNLIVLICSILVTCLSFGFVFADDAADLDSLNAISEQLQDAISNYIPEPYQDMYSDLVSDPDLLNSGLDSAVDDTFFENFSGDLPLELLSVSPEAAPELESDSIDSASSLVKSTPKKMFAAPKLLGTAPVDSTVSLDELKDGGLGFLGRLANLLITPPYVYFVGFFILIAIVLIVKSKLL